MEIKSIAIYKIVFLNCDTILNQISKNAEEIPSS